MLQSVLVGSFVFLSRGELVDTMSVLETVFPLSNELVSLLRDIDAKSLVFAELELASVL